MSPDAADEQDNARLRIEGVIGSQWSEETLTANGVRQHYFRSGGTITLKVVAQITASWRDGEHVAFPGASHFLRHEMRGAAFERFIETVQAFLARA
jgi:hypothetical protein